MKTLPAAPHIQRIPAEIRNDIYDLVLVSDEPVVIDSEWEGWPAILDTCKQIRQEALPVFLGNNTFIAEIFFRRDAAFFSWLRRVKGCEPAAKAEIKTLRLDLQSYLLEHDLKPTGISCCTLYRYRPNFGYWNNFIKNILDAGIQGTQLQYGGIEKWVKNDPIQLGSILELSSVPREKLVFNEFVLAPLLFYHGLIDTTDSSLVPRAKDYNSDPQQLRDHLEYFARSVRESPHQWAEMPIFPDGVLKQTWKEFFEFWCAKMRVRWQEFLCKVGWRKEEDYLWPRPGQ